MFILKDRVEESTNSIGTGNIVLDGATTGNQSFDTAMADNDTTIICIAGGGEWLVCEATYDQDIDELIRGAIYDGSSGAGNNVSFSAGTKLVFMVAPAAFGVLLHTDSVWKPFGKQGIPVLAAQMRPATTNGGRSGNFAGTNQQFPYKAFHTSTQETVYFEMPMPRQLDESALITFDYAWMHPATVTNFGVAFGLSAAAIGNDEASDASWGTEVIVTDTGGTTDRTYFSGESSSVTPSGGTPGAGEMWTFRLRRVPTDAGDNLAVDARLRSANIYITTLRGNDNA